MAGLGRVVGDTAPVDAEGFTCLAGPCAPAGGVLGQALAEPFHLADVGLSLIGVRGDGKHGDAGGNFKDEADRSGLGIPPGHAMIRGRLVSGQARSGRARPLF